ncbi:MAG: hypothetical protein ACOYOO_10210 [Saprospiraceae bacterium]
MQKPALLFVFCAMALLPARSWSQLPPVEVCDIVLRLKGNEVQEVYYGFASGDQILFDFREIEGRTVAAFEVAEYPDNIRYRELESAEILGRSVYVQATGVYKFSIRNERGERTCKLRISRIPAAEKTRAFRTGVRWVDRYDTTYVGDRPANVGDRQVQRSRRVLDKVDTALVNLIDKKERIHSRGNMMEDPFSILKVALPANREEEDRVYKVVSWVYWIGVGSEGEGQYQEANRAVKLAKSLSGAAKSFSIISGPYGALAALALDGVSFFLPPGKGDNILYQVSCGNKVIDQGNGPAAYARHTECAQGEVVFRLENDNLVEVVDVSVRVMAVAVVKTYRTEFYYEQQSVVEPEMKITMKKVPVLSN